MFPSGAQGFDTVIGEPPTLQLSGPACGGPSVCADGSRTVAVTASGTGPPVVRADAARRRSCLMLEAGSLRTELTPLFDFAHPGLDDQPMSIELRIDVGEPSPAPVGRHDADDHPGRTGDDRRWRVPAAHVPVRRRRRRRRAVGGDPRPVRRAGRRRSARHRLVDARGDRADHPDGWLPTAARRPRDHRPACRAGVRDGRLPRLHRAAALPHRHRRCRARPARRRRRARPPGRSPLLRAPRSSPRSTSPPGAPPTTADVAGSAGLRPTSPAPPPCRPTGEVTVATLTNGTPVYVVRHHDGTVSALDPRAASSAVDATGQLHLVTWTASTADLPRRRCVGRVRPAPRRVPDHGPADLRHPRRRRRRRDRLTGRPTARVPGDRRPPTRPPWATPGSPWTSRSASTRHVALPTGATALIDATVIIDPDGAHVCTTGANGLPDRTVPARVAARRRHRAGHRRPDGVVRADPRHPHRRRLQPHRPHGWFRRRAL